MDKLKRKVLVVIEKWDLIEHVRTFYEICETEKDILDVILGFKEKDRITYHFSFYQSMSNNALKQLEKKLNGGK